jgi:hypothetical protein
MMGAIREVFGEEVLGIDPFHVMQEFNNGIRRDLLDFRNCRFRSESKELFALRDWVCSIQEHPAIRGPVQEAPNVAASLQGKYRVVQHEIQAAIQGR